MPNQPTVAQLLIVRDRQGSREPDTVAATLNLPPEWESSALALVGRFGVPPPGIRCPLAVFAQPLNRHRVVVGQVTDQPAGYPDPAQLVFRLLILDRERYESVSDPFAIADRFPPSWQERGSLPMLDWPSEAWPCRPVAEIQAILQNGDSPWLLGAAQALVDGGRVLWEADKPAKEVIRGVWQLLPNRSRQRLWPATFAFSPELPFHVLAMPGPVQPWPRGYLNPEQARDYPESSYELALQIAAESGQQADLDRLFARRSVDETLRLAGVLLIVMMLAAIASKIAA